MRHPAILPLLPRPDPGLCRPAPAPPLLAVVGNYRQVVATIPRSSQSATIHFEREVIRQINGKIPLVRIPAEMVWIEGVPDPEPGVIYDQTGREPTTLVVG